MALNYATKALEDMRAMPLDKMGDKDLRTFFKMVISLLEEAVRVELPMNGGVVEPQEALDNFDHDLRRLPFPIMAFEYSADLFHPVADRHESTKRIALAFEVRPELIEKREDSPIKNTFQAFLDTREALGMVGQSEGFLGIISVCHTTELNLWAPIPSIGAIGYLPDTYPDEGSTGIQAVQPFIRKDTRLHIIPASGSTLEAYSRKGVDGATDVGIRDILTRLASDLSEEVLSVAQTLTMLSANNVGLQLQGGRAISLDKLNKKRTRQGKPPLVQPLEIVINPGRTGNGTSKEVAIPSDRRSPETHWRRGHIRKLASGKRTWVSPAVIGAGASATAAAFKLYRVQAPPAGKP